MNKLREITETTVKARNGGHCGIYTTNDLALMLKTPTSSNFSKLLHHATKAGVLVNVCRNLYVNPLVPPSGVGVLSKIALLLHWNKFIFISLESQLSHLGRISQVLINHLTVMTTGRSGKIKTLYGTIEFTHTSHTIEALKNDLYFDSDIGIFRAKEEKSVRDLKRVGRNIHLLEE
jgi:hypothetical protein